MNIIMGILIIATVIAAGAKFFEMTRQFDAEHYEKKDK